MVLYFVQIVIDVHLDGEYYLIALLPDDILMLEHSMILLCNVPDVCLFIMINFNRIKI